MDFMQNDRIDKRSTSLIDVSELSDESRERLHQLLYRQECRVWLLALGLSLWAMLLLIPEPAYQKFREYSAVAVAICLAVWVGYPAQSLLADLRRNTAPEEGAAIERKFDSSWRSVWDFVPPVIVPILPSLGLLIYRLWGTA